MAYETISGYPSVSRGAFGGLMKRIKEKYIVLACGALTLLCSASQPSFAQAAARAQTIKSYAGRWDLTVETPTQRRTSWVELSQKGGQLQALVLGLWGHPTPMGAVHFADGGIEFPTPPDSGFPDGSIFRGRLSGDSLAGIVRAPNGASWHWTGRRAPALAGKTAESWGKPRQLFDGKDLAGWTFADPTQAGVWSVENGMLVKHGRGSEIVTTDTFRDFKLHIEFNCGHMANSGVYLRGRYEVQIETNSAGAPPDRRTGAVYGYIAPQPPIRSPENQWQSYDITLLGRTVTLVHDGQTLIDHQEIAGTTGGSLDTKEDAPGPIYLQGTEDGEVSFRNIVITPAQE